MRVTILFAFLLAVLASCKPSDSQTKVTPAPVRRGFIQEVDGHRAVIVVQGDTTVVIPFDEPTPGTLLVKGGKVIPMLSRGDLPRVAPICPCCVKTCGSPCEPGVALPCEPLPSFDRWPGGFGRSRPGAALP